MFRRHCRNGEGGANPRSNMLFQAVTSPVFSNRLLVRYPAIIVPEVIESTLAVGKLQVKAAIDVRKDGCHSFPC